MPRVLFNIFPIPLRLACHLYSMKNSCCTCQHLQGLVISTLNAAFVHALPPWAEQLSWAPALPLQANILQAKAAETGLQQAQLKESPVCCSPLPAVKSSCIAMVGGSDGFFADESLLDVLLVGGPGTAAGGFPCSIRSLRGKITLLVQVTATDSWYRLAHRVPAYKTTLKYI